MKYNQKLYKKIKSVNVKIQTPRRSVWNVIILCNSKKMQLSDYVRTTLFLKFFNLVTIMAEHSSRFTFSLVITDTLTYQLIHRHEALYKKSQTDDGIHKKYFI